MSGLRYERAIERNLAELQRAILNRTTMIGIERVGGVTSLFLQLSYYAVFNDYVVHCMKVFERSNQAASFWYIYRTNQPPVERFAKVAAITIASLDEVSRKLKHIRDKTHFHIDVAGVLDTKAVWRDAGL